eukprot:120005_1
MLKSFSILTCCVLISLILAMGFMHQRSSHYYLTLQEHNTMEKEENVYNFSMHLSTPYMDRSNCTNAIHSKYRIFTIGFQASGTMALHLFFQSNNIPSLHYKDMFKCISSNYYHAKNTNVYLPLLSYRSSVNYLWKHRNYSESCSKLDLCNNYVHYSDFGIEPILNPLAVQYNFMHINNKPKFYELLDQQYPSPFSRFILNVRPINNWLNSRWSLRVVKKWYKRMMVDNDYEPVDVFEHWRSDWYNYICNVIKYFSNTDHSHPNLLVFDIENDNITKLIRFFRKDGIRLDASKWKKNHSHNKRSQNVYNTTEIDNIKSACNSLRFMKIHA